MSDPVAPARPSRSRTLLFGIGALVLLALWLRLRSLDWGLPGFSEEATPFRKGAEFWGAGTGRMSADPRFYHYPSLTFYLEFAWLGLSGLAGAILGKWNSLAAFQAALAEPRPELVVAGRLLIALSGAATVIPVAMTARRLAASFERSGERSAALVAPLLAALLLAVSPIHVAESRVIGTDVPMAALFSLFLLFLVRATDGGGEGEWRRAGIALGLAASCKYPAVIGVVPLGVAALEAGGSPRAAAQRLGRPLLAALLAFAVTSPFVLINLPDAFRAIAFERWHMSTGHFAASTPAGPRYYLTGLLPRALGWGGWIAAVAALVTALSRRGAPRVVAVAALGALLLLVTWKVAFDRYLLLALPALVILAGWGIGRVVATAERSRLPLSPAVAPALLLLLFGAAGTVRSFEEGERRARPSTRDLALDWLRATVPHGSLIAAERYSVESAADSFALLVIPFDSVDPHLYDAAYSSPFYAPFDWIVLSSAIGDRYLSRIDDFPAQRSFYEAVARHARLEKEFSPGRGTAGPSIRIFRRLPGDESSDFRKIDPTFWSGVTSKGPLARFLTSLAGVLARGGRDDLALAAAEQAVTLAPRDERALTNLAILRGERGEFLTALNLYQRALEVAPDDPRIHYNLGRLYEGRELWGEAGASYRHAITASPAMIEAWWGLYAAQIHLADRGGAERSLERIASLLPEGARADEVRALLAELRKPAG